MPYKRLDFKKLLENRKTKTISTEESLRDIEPMGWNDEECVDKQQIVTENENNMKGNN